MENREVSLLGKYPFVSLNTSLSQSKRKMKTRDQAYVFLLGGQLERMQEVKEKKHGI